MKILDTIQFSALLSSIGEAINPTPPGNWKESLADAFDMLQHVPELGDDKMWIVLQEETCTTFSAYDPDTYPFSNVFLSRAAAMRAVRDQYKSYLAFMEKDRSPDDDSVHELFDDLTAKRTLSPLPVEFIWEDTKNSIVYCKWTVMSVSVIEPDQTLPHIDREKLARDFIEEMRKFTTPEQRVNIDVENDLVSNDGTCASHDYCDANAIMMIALQHQTDYFNTGDDELCNDIKAAWDRAKVIGFGTNLDDIAEFTGAEARLDYYEVRP
jgi:hypothetical protein